MAIEKLHDEVVAAIGQLAEGKDVDDVGVLDAVGRARLLDEAPDQFRLAGAVGGQHLDRHPLADGRLLARVHRAHATLAQLAQHPVLAHASAGRQLHRHGLRQTYLGRRCGRRQRGRSQLRLRPAQGPGSRRKRVATVVLPGFVGHG